MNFLTRILTAALAGCFAGAVLLIAAEAWLGRRAFQSEFQPFFDVSLPRWSALFVPFFFGSANLMLEVRRFSRWGTWLAFFGVEVDEPERGRGEQMLASGAAGVLWGLFLVGFVCLLHPMQQASNRQSNNLVFGAVMSGWTVCYFAAKLLSKWLFNRF